MGREDRRERRKIQIKDRRQQRKVDAVVHKRTAIVAAELRQTMSVDVDVESRARGRDCADCPLCDRSAPCGWRQGLLLDQHRPDVLGVELRGVELPESGEPVFLLKEAIPEASRQVEVVALVKALSLHMLILVADWQGTITHVLGPDADGTASAAGEVARMKSKPAEEANKMVMP